MWTAFLSGRLRNRVKTKVRLCPDSNENLETTFAKKDGWGRITTLCTGGGLKMSLYRKGLPIPPLLAKVITKKLKQKTNNTFRVNRANRISQICSTLVSTRHAQIQITRTQRGLHKQSHMGYPWTKVCISKWDARGHWEENERADIWPPNSLPPLIGEKVKMWPTGIPRN